LKNFDSNSIRAKLYLMAVLFGLISVFLIINYSFYLFSNRLETEYASIIRLEKKLSNIILNEKLSMNSYVSFSNLLKRYSQLQENLEEDGSLGGGDLLQGRIDILEKIFNNNVESDRLQQVVRKKLAKLVNSVTYIHEHHIAYLKNFLRDNKIETDVFFDSKEFVKSSEKSAPEIDIINVSVEIQHIITDIFVNFYALEGREKGPDEKKFSSNMNSFYKLIRTLDDYSLDAQDGLLVEELLTQGRIFQKSYVTLSTLKSWKYIFQDELRENRVDVQKRFRLANYQKKQFSQKIFKIRLLLQLVSFMLVIIMVWQIGVTSKKIIAQINQINHLIEETRKIQKDSSYRIEIDPQVIGELSVILSVLNSMAEKLDEGSENLKNSRRKKNDFLGSIAHKMQQPIYSISMSVSAILSNQRGEINAEVRAELVDIKFYLKKLDSLLETFQGDQNKKQDRR
jgi:hypothetical protein